MWVFRGLVMGIALWLSSVAPGPMFALAVAIVSAMLIAASFERVRNHRESEWRRGV